MEFFDLTLPLYPGMPVQPGDPAVTFLRVRSHESDGYEVTQLCLGSHSGTHLDAPRHFFPEGATLDQYPIDRLVGPGVVVDCRPAAGTGGPTRIVDAALLTERLRAHSVPSGGLILLWTEGALLSAGAAQVLLESGARLVGVDAPSLDAEPYPAHRLLLGHGVLLAENLHGLDRIGPGPVTCAFLPLATAGMDGAPVRAVAWR
jgi:kynurenine formamidase